MDQSWPGTPDPTPAAAPPPAQPSVPGRIYGNAAVPPGYRQTPTGLAPIPGGPADNTNSPPSGYRYKADGSLEAIPGGPADPDRITRGPSGNAALSGADYIASIPDPARRATVQAMIEGRIPYPTSRALADPHWAQAVADALQADPQFDSGNSRTRVATRQDFTSGASSRNITAINTAIGHLASLQQAGDALDNGNWQFINTVRNWARDATGDPRLVAFNERRQAVVDELEKAFRGSSGTEAGIEQWRESINAAQSPAQLREAIHSGVELLNSRLSALGDAYGRGLGRTQDPMSFLSPHARELMAHLGNGPPPSSSGGPGDGIPGDPGAEGTVDPETGQLVVNITGGRRVPATLDQAWPGLQQAFNQARQANPALTWDAFRQSMAQREFTPAEMAGAPALQQDPAAQSAPGAAVLSQISGTRIGSLERFQALQQFHAASAGAAPEAVAAQFGITPSQAQALDAEYQDAARARGWAAEQDRVQGREGYTDRLEHGATLSLDDEIAGLANAIGHPSSPLESYRQGRDAQRIRLDEARQDTGAVGSALELGGGLFALGPGAAGTNTARLAAMSAARRAFASGATRAEALAAARSAAINRMAAEGAGVSAVQGAGDANGGVSDRIAHAAVAATMAYGGGRLLGRLAAGGTPVVPRAAGEAEQVEAAQAASELGIDLPKFIIGNESAQRAGNRLDQTMGGGPVISSARRALTDQSAAARDTIAANVGTALEPAAAGDVATAAARTWRGTSGDQGRTLYTRAQALAGDTMVTPQSTMQTIAQLIREEREVPGGTEALPILQRYADAFDAGGTITINGARKMRTTLRQQLSQTMTPDNADRITNQIMGSVSQDIETSLNAAGRTGAIQAYREADRFWAQRMDTIRDVMEPYVGRNGDNWGSDVVRAMQNDARGNGERLAMFLNTIPQEEANTIRSTLISRLGQATDGRQNAAGDAFSLDTFLTNWNQIRGSRGQIFPADTVRSLNHLALVANRVKAAAATANRPNTGSIISGLFTTSPTAAGITATLMSGDPKLAAVGILSSLGIALRQNASARLLASPAFARRLAATPMNVAGATEFWSRPWVAAMARANPVIGADILGFQDHLIRSLRSAGTSNQRQNR